MPHLHVSPLILTAALCACASTSRLDPALTSSPEIISQQEIISSRGISVYDVIQRVHANFLSYRGENSFVDKGASMPMVFIDDQVYGPVSVLRNIPASQISEIRLYRSWEAVIKYGSGLPAGAISLKSRLDN
jgi:hypothetical protein